MKQLGQRQAAPRLSGRGVVVVAVGGAVVVGGRGLTHHRVENGALDQNSVLTQTAFAGFDFLNGGHAEARHQQASARLTANQRRIGHGEDGRGVDQNQVVQRRQFGKHLVEVVMHQQLRGVGRGETTGDEIQMPDTGGVDDLGTAQTRRQCVGQPVFGLQTEEAMQVAFAHVSVDQQYAFASLRDDDRQVAGNE